MIAYQNDYIDTPTRVYNFTVGNTHNYFAGGFGAWVHNAGNAIDCGPYAVIPKKIDFSDLGKKIGEGGVKEVFDWKDGLVVGVAKPGKPAGWVVKEFNTLRDLEKAGLPVVKTHGLTKVDGRQAIVYSKVDGVGSKDIVKNVNGKPTIVGSHPNLNSKSVTDLRKIRQSLLDNKITVSDLQFIIKNDGSVLIADPADLINKKPKLSSPSIRTIDRLIEAAEGKKP